MLFKKYYCQNMPNGKNNINTGINIITKKLVKPYHPYLVKPYHCKRYVSYIDAKSGKTRSGRVNIVCLLLHWNKFQDWRLTLLLEHEHVLTAGNKLGIMKHPTFSKHVLNVLTASKNLFVPNPIVKKTSPKFFSILCNTTKTFIKALYNASKSQKQPPEVFYKKLLQKTSQYSQETSMLESSVFLWILQHF